LLHLIEYQTVLCPVYVYQYPSHLIYTLIAGNTVRKQIHYLGVT
jgi:hypothetical protein